ncbi:hypothetical protein [Legionella sp.]|uniref:hypothetical protein n=1 Tax=Legionella sp. TaxID=459 RepID=UPI003C9EC1DC
MQKKKIITIGPVSAQSEDIEFIASSLSFLSTDYTIDYLDSLSIMEELPNKAYYKLWEQKLAACIEEYDAFFGFAFGGVIIQQCFPLFTKVYKPIILFSTPTFANNQLTKQLNQVISLCRENKLQEALKTLYHFVFYPNQMPLSSSKLRHKTQACKRLIFGLTRVLSTDSTEILKKNKVNHTHLIGEYSNLVNTGNVIKAKNGRLIVVPKASMRILQDNLLFCQKIILEALK